MHTWLVVLLITIQLFFQSCRFYTEVKVYNAAFAGIAINND